MATLMVMPLLGQTMEEGTIIRWFKNEGDKITSGEPLLEVMTDKVNMEVEAPESGVLRRILSKPDDIVPVKDPICIIGTADEPIDDLLKGEAKPAAESAPAVQEVPAPAPQAAAPAAAPAPATQVAAPVPEGRVFSSPAARRVAGEKGIDINLLAGMGTGPNGRIVEADVLNYAASAPKATPLAARMAADMGVQIGVVAGTGVGGKVTSQDLLAALAAPAAPALVAQTIPLTGIRKAVAVNVAKSASEAPHVTLVSEVDMTECIKFRAQVLESVEKTMGVRISYTDIIVKAVAKALVSNPMLNSSLRGDEIVVHGDVNIGIAAAIEGGLVVPVVKDALGKSLTQVSKEIKELAARARSKQSAGGDLQGGTFTISNLGTYGVESFNPIITPGQAAILGVCAMIKKPVVVKDEIVVRTMMNLCLSFDHRIVDGAPAAECLATIKQLLESPYLIFV